MYSRPLYKGHWLRFQIFTLPIVSILLQPLWRGQPLYKGQNKWIYIVPDMSLVRRFHCSCKFKLHTYISLSQIVALTFNVKWTLTHFWTTFVWHSLQSSQTMIILTLCAIQHPRQPLPVYLANSPLLDPNTALRNVELWTQQLPHHIHSQNQR